MVNNSTNINKRDYNLWPQAIENKKDHSIYKLYAYFRKDSLCS
jgi:hypothetical protein